MFRQRAESSRRVGELRVEAGSVVPVLTATGAKSHPPSTEGTGRRHPCPETGRIARPSGCADVRRLSCAGTGHRWGEAAPCAHSVLRTRAPEGAVPGPKGPSGHCPFTTFLPPPSGCASFPAARALLLWALILLVIMLTHPACPASLCRTPFWSSSTSSSLNGI